MPEELPPIGLNAVIDNVDGFEKDAKKVQDSYRQIAEAEAKVQKASEAQVDATERAGKAWQASAAQAAAAADAWDDAATVMTDAQKAAGGQAAAVEDADQAWDGLFDRFGEVKDRAGALAAGQKELVRAMEQGAQSALVSEKAYTVLEDAYERMARQHGPEVVQALRDMEREFIDGGGTVEDWALQVQNAAGDAADGLVGAADEASSAWENMANILSLGALQMVSTTIGRAGDQILDLAKGAVMTSARIEELDAVMANLAEQNDLTASALRNQVEAVKAQGIQSSVAYNLVSQFVRANLDLGKASELARVAQDAAVISMEDSSQALAGLLHGIMTLQPEVLRYRGIIVDLQGDYKRWADANNRTVQSMTGTEKQMVALESVISEGASVAGTYEAAMDTAGKQLRSFARYSEELKEDFGNTLLPVFTEGVFAAKDLMKAMMALPEPIKATLAATGALTGGLLKGTSAMLSMGSQAAMLALAINQLGVATRLSSLAFLGPVGLVAAIGAVATIGLVAHVQAQEKAHRDEAAAILDSSESYQEYIRELKDAALEGYAFSEALYEVVKAKEEADEAFATEEIQDAVAHVKDLTMAWWTVINMWANAPDDPMGMHDMDTAVEMMIASMDDLDLVVASNRDQMIKMAVGLGFSTDAAELYADRISEAVKESKDLKLATDASTVSIGRHEDIMLGLIPSQWQLTGAIIEWKEALEGAADSQRELRGTMVEMMEAAMEADPAIEGLTRQIIKLMEESGQGAAIGWSIQQLADIARDAEEEIADLRDKAKDSEEKATERYHANLEKMAQDHAKRRKAILEDMADVHADLLRDMEKAEEDYQADRLALAEQYAQDIADAEADLAQARTDLHDDLLKDMASAERKYAQNVEDAHIKLGRDLEDLQRKLQAKLLSLEEEAYQEREELAQEYGERLKSLTEKYASEAEAIAKKYSTEPEAPDFDEQREALQQELKDLEEQNKGRMFINRGREDQLRRQLKDLMDAELEALEERKTAELEELEKWLAEEQAVQDAAYQEAIDKEIAAAQERAVERIRQYGERLEDLDKALGREKDTLNRRYKERLGDLEAAHAREMAEMKRANAERLAALDEQLAQEQARLVESAQQRRDSLAEQLADEKTAYRDRRTALGKALDDEKTTITEKLAEQSEVVATEASAMTDDLIKAWEGISPPIASALRAVTSQTIIPWVNEVLDEIRRMKEGIERELESSPVSGWFLGVGKSMGRGLEEGFNLKDVLGSQLDELGKFKIDAEGILETGSPSKWAERMGESVTAGFASKATLEPSIGSFAMDAFESDVPAVPGQDMAVDPFLTGVPEMPDQEMAVMPYFVDAQALAAQSQVEAPTPPMMAAGGMGSSSTTTRTNTLNVDAHYTNPQSERSLRQDMEMYRIGMRW